MNPRLERIKEKIKNGQPVIGVFVELADSSISEIVGYSGCDFAWIDSEHGMMDRREIYHHVMAAQAAGCCAFVRVPGVEYYQIKNTLDMGPDGIIFPFVNTPEIARTAVQACTYPQDGGKRGLGPLRAIKYGVDDEMTWVQTAKDEVWKIFQIECMEAVENLDAIAATEGVHSLFVGPGDLGMSNFDKTPEEKAAITEQVQRRVGELAKKHGLYAGSCAGMNKASCYELLGRGIHWMTIAQDARIFSDTLKKAVQDINE
ncbi:MAG: host specificity protein [Christensenellaceae bacterium]|nr:host specificity protein [Christensenellaceae bacterium]